jgi:uncharacterized membrane protein
MRPVRSIIVAVVLIAAAAGTGFYIARSTSHPSASARPAASVAPTTTTPAATVERAQPQGRTSSTRSQGSAAPTTQPTATTSPLADRISDPQVAADRLVDAWIRGDPATARKLASRAVSDRLFSESPPAQTPVALPCRPAGPAVFVCSYPLADRAELTIIVEGGASAGYGVSGIEFGD